MITASSHVDSMPGGSQSHLISANNNELYVVKFKNNPQSIKVLFNDFVGSRIAKALGLNVPDCEVIEVSKWLIDSTKELRIHKMGGYEVCSPGRQFASHFRGGAMLGLATEYLPEADLARLTNLGQYAGILAFDKWTCNTDGRQALFIRSGYNRRYSAMFIDQGYCFNQDQWCFKDIPLRGVFSRNSVYAEISGWESFEPWLQSIEAFDPTVLWQIVEQVPPEWYDHKVERLELLVDALVVRRSIVRDLVDAFRRSDRNPFPGWTASMPFRNAYASRR